MEDREHGVILHKPVLLWSKTIASSLKRIENGVREFACRDICEMALNISESRFRELRLDSLDVLPGCRSMEDREHGVILHKPVLLWSKTIASSCTLIALIVSRWSIRATCA
jgi:hypothetical protein